MPRRYEELGIDELEALASRGAEDATLLADLLDELSHRPTQRARELRGRLLTMLGELLSPAEQKEMLDDEQESADFPPGDIGRAEAVAKIRPPGTPGLPAAAHEKELEADITLELAPDADVIDRYASALRELIQELRASPHRRRHEITNGRRGTRAGEGVVYSFEVADEGGLFDDASVEIDVEGQRFDGTIVGVNPGALVLSIAADLGARIARASLLLDETALLESLKEKLLAVRTGDFDFNRALADAVVGAVQPPTQVTPLESREASTSLKPSQARAHERVRKQALTYIWGPPGCGKTYTLSEVVRTVFDAGKRALICSNTNKAVDQVLYQICKALGKSHAAMRDGRILRMGRIADDKLSAEFATYVSLDDIVNRRSQALAQERQKLQERLPRIERELRAIQDTLNLFVSLDAARSNLAELAARARAANESYDWKFQQLGTSATRLQGLDRELLSARGLRGLFGRSAESIRADIAVQRAQFEQQQANAEQARHLRGELAELQRVAESDYRKLTEQAQGIDREAIRAKNERLRERRERIDARLEEIDSLLADLRKSIVREARVLGATGTRAFLSAKDLGQADVVIVDEASMLLLPMVWFAAGLSRERVVVCGDFRQIPPIVRTRQQAVFDVIGRDVFTAAGVSSLGRADSRLVMLDTQRRMHEDICTLISGPMYGGRLMTDADPQWQRSRRQRARPPSPFDGALTIVDTSTLGGFEGTTASFSRFNLMHALLVRNLAWHLSRGGFVTGPRDLGVCTPYAAQANMIRKMLESESLTDVQVGTVHAFQGDERNAIVLEIPESPGARGSLGQFVQGAPPHHLGARLVNVAVSRAENHLIVIANLAHLDRHLPGDALLRGILASMQAAGRVVPGEALLALRPFETDLQGLSDEIRLEDRVRSLGLFNQHSFDRAVSADIGRASDSVAIFSGFVAPGRVGELQGLLEGKVHSGVAVRCVTRPPHLNGSIRAERGKEALDSLEGCGCIVDCRARIHEKIVIVDRKIVWHGSLNALSYSYRTDESMTRVVSEGFAGAVAAAMARTPASAPRALRALAEAENPRCGDCESRTYYDRAGARGFFRCEDRCGWTLDADAAPVRRAPAQPDAGAATDAEVTEEPRKCPDCGSSMVPRTSSYGPFWGCSRFPACRGKVDARRR